MREAITVYNPVKDRWQEFRSMRDAESEVAIHNRTYLNKIRIELIRVPEVDDDRTT